MDISIVIGIIKDLIILGIWSVAMTVIFIASVLLIAYCIDSEATTTFINNIRHGKEKKTKA